MTSIILGKVGTKSAHLDLDALLRGRLLIQANSGNGKSWLLRRIAEELFGKVQVIIIDPEGEFATLREKFGYVLVGKGGETPADPRSAALVAHKLLELRASAVCDLYEMKPFARHEWVRNFCEALIDAPKSLWHSCVVIVDEAHTFCPEKGAGESVASESVIGLATRGRKRGYAIILATQRLGKLRKDAAAELLNVMIGGTFIDIDRKRAADALGVYGKDQHEFFDQIKVLKRGLFFSLGPAISDERVLLEVGSVRTTHPEAGSSKHSAEPPPAPEAIARLLPKLSDLPKAAEEKAKTEADYRAQIRDLKSQLTMAHTKVASREAALAVAEGKKKGMIDHGYIKNVTQLLKEEREHSQKLRDYFIGLFEAIRSQFRTMKIEPPKKPTSKRAWEVDTSDKSSVQRSPAIPYAHRAETRPHPAQHVQAKRPSDVEVNGKLRSGAERMLAALASWSPNGMSEGQMRAHAGLKKSGTFSAYMSDLRKGYIEERDGMVFATQEGLDYCKHIPAAPQTTEEVLGIWRPKLRDGARRMLDALVEKGGESITKEELGDLAQLQKSGTFSAYLSDLKTARLAIVNRDGTVSANRESLFL
jgi:uncharacterized protein DUF87